LLHGQDTEEIPKAWMDPTWSSRPRRSRGRRSSHGEPLAREPGERDVDLSRATPSRSHCCPSRRRQRPKQRAHEADRKSL